MTPGLRGVAVLALLAAFLLGGCRSAGPPAPSASDQALGWLHTAGSRLLGEDDGERRIRAVSWSGLETESCAPHGLDSITMDAALSSMAAMGFNTVRLPYSSACLRSSTATTGGPSPNADMVGASPQRVMDLVVERAGAHHLSVLLDRHRISSSGQSELWYDAEHPERGWIDDWTRLARRYAHTPTVIGADLHNEPHGPACWACGDPTRDWAAAATRAGNAILGVNPHWLIVVEGVEHQTAGESTWWGGGLADAREHPITLARPHQVVYSPHAYPPSVFDQPQFREDGYPDNLPAYWDRTWGYLQTENIAPVLLGEFGSRLKTGRDRDWLATMVGYLNATRASFGYWAYNPDSSDTGGLVKSDWVTPERAKLKALAPLFVELPTATPVTVPPTDPPTPSVAPSPSATPSSGPSLTPSPPEQPLTPSPAPSTVGPGTLAARWQAPSSWDAGYAVNLVLTADGAPTKAWRLSWADPQATAIQNAWGMTCVVSAGRVACEGKDWGAWIAAGASVTVGVQVTSTGGAPSAPTLSPIRIR